MTDFFGFPERPPFYISSYSGLAGAHDVLGASNRAPASTAWPSANLGIYIPFALPWPYIVRRVFWGNGSAAGNMDFGIYTSAFKRLYSATPTAQSPASGLQYVTPTAFLLPPGRYYMGISNNGTTNRGWGIAAFVVQATALGGMFQQASVATLPDPMVPAAITTGFVPLCGISRLAA